MLNPIPFSSEALVRGLASNDEAKKRPITPLIAVDIIVEVLEVRDGLPEEEGVVIIERVNPPHGWALPGGFVDVGETLLQAAEREAKEELNVRVNIGGMLGMYDDPLRDPRGHTISAVFYGWTTEWPVAGDDAKNIRLVNPYKLTAYDNLVFDHRKILVDYVTKVRRMA